METKKTLSELQVGDYVIHSTRYGNEVAKVWKVIKTMIIAGVPLQRFNRKRGTLIGKDSFDIDDIHIPQEGEIEAVRKHNIRLRNIQLISSMVNDRTLDKFTDEDLDKTYNIFKPYLTK